MFTKLFFFLPKVYESVLTSLRKKKKDRGRCLLAGLDILTKFEEDLNTKPQEIQEPDQLWDPTASFRGASFLESS